jgi:hypothetical protein
MIGDILADDNERAQSGAHARKNCPGMRSAPILNPSARLEMKDAALKGVTAQKKEDGHKYDHCG